MQTTTKPRKSRPQTPSHTASISAGLRRLWKKRHAAEDMKLIEEIIASERYVKLSWRD